MKSFFIASAIAATAAAGGVTIIPGSDNVPLIYSSTPYPNPPYDGVQYNATAINGIAYNNSNEWPCLTAEQYFTVPPSCAKQCLIGTFKNATICDNDDFYCHCQAAGSAELDKYIIPCLTAADGPCTGEEIGELANFVHGALCPYFMAHTYEEAYGHCDGTWSSSAAPKPTTSSKKSDDYWPTTTSTKKTTTTKGADYWPTTTSTKTTEKCSTSTQATWTKECDGPTTFWIGEKTWTVTKATTITVTDWPITWTKPISTGTWAPVEWTTAAAVPASTVTWAYSTPAAGWATTATSTWATGTAAWGASPVQFTGAASNNKVAGAVAAVAAGAALLM